MKYKDETNEEKMKRVREEAQEEEYLAKCRDASRADIRGIKLFPCSFFLFFVHTHFPFVSTLFSYIY